jgi:multidrug efflux pump subunit AcrB
VGNDLAGNRLYADTLLEKMKYVSGTADLRIQQPFDEPYLRFSVERTKAEELGFSAHDIAQNLLVSLSGSFQTSPSFWVDPQDHVSYQIATQTPQYRADTLQDIENIPVTGTDPTAPPSLMASLVSMQRGTGMAVVSHYNIAPVIDIFGAVTGRDLGGVAATSTKLLMQTRKQLPRGSRVVVRGQVQTMRASYIGLLSGLAFSIVLVYLLIVVNFQSWLDPFIMISALPAALAGIAWFLFVTHTTLSVPALMGAIMCMGVATSNSILVVSFATEKMQEGSDSVSAALEAGFTRFRPVLMTALAMIIGMVPMALGLGDGGEQNAPLGRAVIGGLLFATVSTLFFVPAFFSLLQRSRRRPAEQCKRALGPPYGATTMSPQIEDKAGLGRSSGSSTDAKLKRALTWRRWLALAIASMTGALLDSGIRSRVKAAQTLRTETSQVAVTAVSVVTPKRTAPAQEIILPGNVQPFH